MSDPLTAFPIATRRVTATGDSLMRAADTKAVRSIVGVPVLGNLRIPSYTGTNDTTHVHVTHHETGWNGWKYIMSHTPMPATPLEYPSVCVSQDGVNWVLPNGCPNPITNISSNSAANTYQHFADNHHLITPEGKLRVYWIAANDSDPKRHALLAAETEDFVNWTLLGTGGFVLEAADHVLTSPSIIALPDDSYVGFFSETTSGLRKLVRRTSADGIAWSAPSDCTVPANYKVWHANIQLIDGTYHLLGLQNYPTSRPGSGINYLTSADGITWVGDPTRMIHADDYTAEPKAFAGGGYYRSGFVLHEDGLADLWLVTLLSDGSGDGDTSGDTVGAAGLYQNRRVAFARGVDLTAQSRWEWTAAPNVDMTVAILGDPYHDGLGQRIEKSTPDTSRKGAIIAKWASLAATGLVSGAREQLTIGEKPWLLAGTNNGIGAFFGRLDVMGVLLTTPIGAIIVSGSVNATNATKILGESAAGDVSFTGAIEWALILNTAVDPALDVLPVAGDTIVGATSGASATVQKITQGGRLLYPMKPANRHVFQNGEQVLLNGVAMAIDGTPVTISSQQRAPTSSGIAILAHFYEAGNAAGNRGGFIDIWNTSASTFHGEVHYRSYR